MVKIKEIVYTQKFERDVKKLEKQIRKIVEDPEFGKPLRCGLKGEWTIRVKPYRLIYAVQGVKADSTALRAQEECLRIDFSALK